MIEDIREMIDEKEDIPPREQFLCFERKELKDGHSLSDYGISDGTKLRLMLVGQHVNADMRIYVKTPAGNTVKLYMVSEALVECVKWKMCDIEGIPADQQRLSFEGRELKNGCGLFSNYRILNDSVLDMSAQAPPPRNSLPIFIKNLNGRTDTLNVDQTDTVMAVKHMIEHYYRHKLERSCVAEDWRLTHAGRQPEDARTLLHYYIGSESTLHMIPRLHGD